MDEFKQMGTSINCLIANLESLKPLECRPYSQ